MKETSYSDRKFWSSCVLLIIIIGEILVLFIYVTWLASKEIFSPSNKIHREVGRAKDLTAPPYKLYTFMCIDRQLRGGYPVNLRLMLERVSRCFYSPLPLPAGCGAHSAFGLVDNGEGGGVSWEQSDRRLLLTAHRHPVPKFRDNWSRPSVSTCTISGSMLKKEMNIVIS
jgi:hypothetical protein